MPLPKDIIKKHGIGKKAWEVYRARQKGKSKQSKPGKKVVEAKVSPQKSAPTKIEMPKEIGGNVVGILVQNFAMFQKTLANLTEKLGNLTTQVSELLTLFETAAKNIAEKPELGFEREFRDKLNVLLDQSKAIMRGVTAVSEMKRTESTSRPAPMPAMPAPAMPKPAIPPAKPSGPAPMPSQPASRGPAPEQYSQSSFGEKKPKPLPT